MTDSLDHAAAIVGVSAILPDAPDAAALLAQRHHRPLLDQRGRSASAGTRRSTTTRIRRRPRRRTRRSGAGCGNGTWDPFALEAPDPAEGRRRDGRRPQVGGRLHAHGADRRRLAGSSARPRSHRGDHRQRPLGREALPDGAADHVPRPGARARARRELRRAARGRALDDRGRAARQPRRLAPGVTEDTMPGELGNCIAGRIANLFNLHGPNFTTDAACASALAAMDATVDGLLAHEFDVAITGGVDRNMGAHTFVKFCAIGALSPSGTRPYSDGADGFVMGEGAALFVVKRLADAVRAGDRIYAVVRGVGSASDGRGKGITAPNPVGQRLAVERAWRNAGLSPAECTLIEGHGTSTSVGDAVELSSLMEAFSQAHVAPGSIALGSVKSNIGHLKGAAGAAGMLKTTLALHDKVLPPSLNFERPNPNVDWTASPFAVNTELRDWDVAGDRARVAGVSAFGFGGTNFHLVMEEYVPGRHRTNGDRSSVAVPAPVEPVRASEPRGPAPAKPPLRGALVLGAADDAGLANALRTELAEARQGRHLDPTAPSSDALRAPERIAIDYADGPDLVAKAELASRVLRCGQPRRLAGAARTRHPPRQRQPRQGGVPVHRPGLSVREHARRAAPARARGRGAVRGGRRDHGSAARGPPSIRHHVRRPGGSGGDGTGGGGAAPHRDPAAGRDHRRHRAHAPAGRIRDRTGSGHGSLGRRVRGPGQRRRAVVRGRARGRQRARARDGEPSRRGSRGDGRGDGPAGGGRGDRRRDRGLRRARQHQLDSSGRARRRHRGGRSRRWPRSRSVDTRRSRCRSATASTPRSWRRRAARCGRCSSVSACGRRSCRSSPTSTASSIRRARAPGSRCSTCSAARSPRRCSS